MLFFANLHDFRKTTKFEKKYVGVNLQKKKGYEFNHNLLWWYLEVGGCKYF